MLADLLYLAALILVSPVVLYRNIRHGRYRRGISQKLFGLSRAEAVSLVRTAASPQPQSAALVQLNEAHSCVWLHAVSVGEVNLLPNLVRRLEKEMPQARIVISTSTDTGYDLAAKQFGQARVFFFPLDFSWAVARTLRNLKPELLVLTELELWPNLIRTAEEMNCRVVVINGRLSERSAQRYQKFAWITRNVFKRLSWVGCQDKACRDRFVACGSDRSRLNVTGSMKFDNAVLSRDSIETQRCAEWAGVDPWHRVWVVGSTQPGEESMALRIYKELRIAFPELRMILVPRHAERFDCVASEIEQSGFVAHRRSCDDSLHFKEWTNERVILIDTIGELKHWWGVCHIATVGGSFGNRGGQNMLEPAGFGAAVSFGPNTKNFAEIANRLLEARGAVRVQDEGELRQFVGQCLNDQPSADDLGRAAREVVQTHLGATDRTVASLLRVINERQSVEAEQRVKAA
jgi:3-deoxy-D-manno-octulosonic-acid transferase